METRVERPLLALVCVPLVMIAATLTGLWCVLPVLVIESWWFSPSRLLSPNWRWSWVLAVEEGIFGTMWAFAGATNLAAFRDHTLVVGGIWAAAPAVVAIAGALSGKKPGLSGAARAGTGSPRSDTGAIGDDVVLS